MLQRDMGDLASISSSTPTSTSIRNHARTIRTTTRESRCRSPFAAWRRQRRRNVTTFPLFFLCPIIVMLFQHGQVECSIGGGDGNGGTVGRGGGLPPPPPPPPPPTPTTRDRSKNPSSVGNDDDVASGGDDQDDWSRQYGQYYSGGPDDVPIGDGYATDSTSWYKESQQQQQPQRYWGVNDNDQVDTDLSRSGWNNANQGSSLYNNDDDSTHIGGTYVGSTYQDGDYSQQQGRYYGNNHNDKNDGPQLQQQRQPLPSGGPAVTGPKVPIHYEFPASKEAMEEAAIAAKNVGGDDDDVDKDGVSFFPAKASARRDLVTRYWSTRTGKLQIMACSALLGAALGNFLSKSFIPIGGTMTWGLVFAFGFLVSTWFRTPLGELTRAVGLSIMLVLQRSRRIRKDYPTWNYIPAAVGLRNSASGGGGSTGRQRRPPVRPFPPSRNPWRYAPRSSRDPDFNMVYAMVSMAFVGSTCGGSLPIIPTWMGALAGASSFAYACTWQSPRGDLARICGMRVVKAVGELWEIQADLQIIPKATVVSSQLIDRVMILDRKHRVKDRFLSLASKGYEQATKVAAQIQQQQRGGFNSNNNDGGVDVDDNRRGARPQGGRRDSSYVADNDRGPPEGRGSRDRRRGRDDGYGRRDGRDFTDEQSSRSRRGSKRGGDDFDDPKYSNRRQLDDDLWSTRLRDGPSERRREYDGDDYDANRSNNQGPARDDVQQDDRENGLKDPTLDGADKKAKRGLFWR